MAHGEKASFVFGYYVHINFKRREVICSYTLEIKIPRQLTTLNVKGAACELFDLFMRINHVQEKCVILTKIMQRVIHHDKKSSVKPNPKRANFLETKAQICYSYNCFFVCIKGSYNQDSTVSLLDVHYHNTTKCINIHYKDTLSLIYS